MGARRHHGTGSIYVKHGSYYGRWTVDGRRVNRKLGTIRKPGTREGLTKRQAEAAMRRQIEAVTVAPSHDRLTIAEAGERLVERLQVKGRKRTTIEAVESALRIHLIPQFGSTPLERIDVRAVERFIAAERRAGRAPKSIRNYLGVLHSIFELAIERGWAQANPVKAVDKPQEAPSGEIRFLTKEEVEALLRAAPDDALGSLERTLYLTAAMTGLRQSELFGLRWRDVDWPAGKVRVQRAYVRGEFGTTKSQRGFRTVPLADRVAGELDAHSQRSPYTAEDDLVFAHPHTGKPLDRSRVRKRFKAAIRRADVRDVTFHELRHTFGTRMAAAGVAIRTLQEWMGHRGHDTTLIYAHYSPDAQRERDLIDRAFGGTGSVTGSDLREIESNSNDLNRLKMRGQA